MPILLASSSKTRMNSSPMTFRLVSGSITPFSLLKNLEAASACRIGMPMLLLKKLNTRSTSSRRRRPLFTKIQVSWSPIALWMRAETTAESTPPERALMTLAGPHLGAYSFDAVVDEIARRPVALAAAYPVDEIPEDGLPVGRMYHLGMELQSEDAIPVADDGHRGILGVGQRPESGRHRLDTVAVTHPDRQVISQTGEKEGVSLVEVEPGVPVFLLRPRGDPPAQLLCQELHAVADAQYGQAAFIDPGGRHGRSRTVDAGRAAGQNDAPGVQRGDLFPGSLVAHDLTVDAALADTAGDEQSSTGSQSR